MPSATKRPARPPTHANRTRRGVVIVLLVAACGAALIDQRRQRDAAPSAVDAKPAVATRAARPLALPLANPLALPLALAPASTGPAAAQGSQVPTGHITAIGDMFEIDIQAMPLGQAASLLAKATRTPPEGIEALRGATRLITLRWQGSSAGAAWQLLLSPHANYVSQCALRTCSVQVVGLLTAANAGVAAAGPASPVTRTGTAAPPSLDPPGLFPSDG